MLSLSTERSWVPQVAKQYRWPSHSYEEIMLLLTDEIINSLLSVRDCVGDMELAYQQLAAEQAAEVGRERMFLDDRKTGIVYRLGRQCGAVSALGVAALRVNSTRKGFRKGI